MVERDFEVRPRSWKEIEEISQKFRSSFGLNRREKFSLLNLVEKVMCDALRLFRIQILSRQEMGNAEGMTSPDGEVIYLREDVYDAAGRGESRANLLSHMSWGTGFFIPK